MSYALIIFFSEMADPTICLVTSSCILQCTHLVRIHIVMGPTKVLGGGLYILAVHFEKCLCFLFFPTSTTSFLVCILKPKLFAEIYICYSYITEWFPPPPDTLE